MKEQGLQKPVLFFSNRMEALVEALVKKLFAHKASPFERRIVLIPCLSLKPYLFSQIAQNCKVASGMEILTIKEGVCHLIGPSCSFLSENEISFRIEGFLLENLLELSTLEPLLDYFQISSAEDLQNISVRRKIRSFSEELSRILDRYAYLEPQLALHWFSGAAWKRSIWLTVFGCEDPFAAMVKRLDLIPCSLHLFAFSHLPSCYFDLFRYASPHYYFVSPCEFFLEDLCSDRERIFIEKALEGKKVRFAVREQMSFYLRQRNTLLANWGKAGRALIRALGEEESYVEELYEEPASGSLLRELQRDLLYLSSDSEKKTCSAEDRSLICFSASSKLREVEILLDTLCDCVRKDPAIQPQEIVVFSPNLESYLPYIHMVFGASHSPFDYAIHGIALDRVHPSIQALCSFFSLPKDRFSLEAVFSCFSWPCVRQKQGWGEETISLLQQWYQSAHVLWGLSWEQRKHISQELVSDEIGSWEFGSRQLLAGLGAIAGDLDYIYPLPIVEWTDAELLGKWIHLLHGLEEGFAPIVERKRFSFSAWASHVTQMIETYFLQDGELQRVLYDLKALSLQLQEERALLSFESFWSGFERLLTRKSGSFQGGHIQAIHFSGWEGGCGRPAEILCLLGCDEASLPRSEIPSCLDVAGGQRSIPSKAEQDRYLFLEMLIHARKHLIMSYQRISQQDHKEQNPSFCIQELFAYLDEHFATHGGKPSTLFMKHHPAMSFHKSYFSQDCCLPNFSKIHALAAKSYYRKNNKSFSSFFTMQCSKSPKFPSEVDLRRLSGFAKDPIRFFFQEGLGIYFKKEPSQDPEFFLSNFDKAILKKELICSADAFQKKEKQGLFPRGVFGEIAKKNLVQDVEKIKRTLLAWNISAEDLNEVEFVKACRSPEKREGRWIFPAITFFFDGEQEVSLVGRVFPVCSQGFLCFGRKDKLQEMIRIWPEYLAFCAIASEMGACTDCIFAESGERLGFSIEDPRGLLQKYLSYYLRSLAMPSPLIIDWAEKLLKKEVLQDVKPKWGQWIDPYTKWWMDRGSSEEMIHLQNFWQGEWEDLFSPLFTEGLVHEKV